MRNRSLSDGEPGVPAYPIESVDNALRLLLLFREHDSLRVSEVSERLGIARSTAHRLLAMLSFHGFAVRDEGSHAYEAGPSLVELSVHVSRRPDLRAAARPVMERIVGEVRETIHFSVLHGTEVLFVDCVESPHPLRAGARVGTTLPAHSCAAGKVLLACLGEHEIAAMYRERPFEQRTGRTIASYEELARELARVRRDGFAVNREESESGLVAVAVAVPGPRRRLAALTMAAPVQRVQEAELRHAARVLAQGAETIGAAL